MASPVAAPSNRRALVIAGVGVGILVLFFVVTKLIGGGGGSKAPTITLPPQAAGPRATTTTTAPGATTGQPGETFEVFSTKNPFQPPSGVTTGGTTGTTGGTTGTTGASATTGATGTTGTSGTSGATSGTAGTTGQTSSTGTATTGTTGSNEPRRAQRVALLDIFLSGGQREANVRVDDTVYQNLKPGDAFATSYKVVSLEDKCGTFLFGDSQFRLCEGEEVLK